MKLKESLMKIMDHQTPGIFVQTLNPMSGKMEWKIQAEDYDYRQEVARAAFADMLHDTERVIFVREHGVHAGPKDYFVVVVVVVICGSI
jgi:hypothetical protein